MNGPLTPETGAEHRLPLPQVTLCAVSSVNVEATLRAMEACLDQAQFADAILLTDAQPTSVRADIRVVTINRLTSAKAYSDFILRELVDHVVSSHCLIVQWDGYILDTARWRGEFLDYDYIGASWPQFDDGHDVGNGGFSLRSRRLMYLCKAPEFSAHHPEDIAICRTNRTLLDAQGIRFAPRELADRFAAERTGNSSKSFGYHGVFLMPEVLGIDSFWSLYRSLDDRSSLAPDFGLFINKLWGGRNPILRFLRLIGNRIVDYFKELAR